MALDNPNVIDAVGVEESTNCVVLTIADSWDWKNLQDHLMALQSKLNAYFHFVESGQLIETYPSAVGREVIIDVIGRYPIPQPGLDLLTHAAHVASTLNVRVRNRWYPG